MVQASYAPWNAGADLHKGLDDTIFGHSQPEGLKTGLSLPDFQNTDLWTTGKRQHACKQA